MAHYDFIADVIDGEEGELQVMRMLELLGGTSPRFNKTKTHDIIMYFAVDTGFGRGDVSFEVKTDVYVTPERDSGNMFLESECRGQRSGITVTKADWFIYYFPALDEIWCIRRENLIKLIKEEHPPKVTGGDPGSNTKGWLMQCERFAPHFTIRNRNGQNVLYSRGK